MTRPSSDPASTDDEDRDLVVLHSDENRKARSRLWILVQVLTLMPLVYAAGVVLDMSCARPGVGYTAPNGVFVQCEALSRGRRLTPPSCARYGSKETNPVGYGIALAAMTSLGVVIWVSTRPGRGLRMSRAR